MNQVNWEAMTEPVQQFIRGLVIVRNGEPMVRVMPVPKATKRRPADVEWSAAANERRCALIDREIDGILTPDERIELEDLQQQLRRYVNRVAPLPLAYVRQLLEELERKAEASLQLP